MNIDVQAIAFALTYVAHGFQENPIGAAFVVGMAGIYIWFSNDGK
jgi:hypothetical protein